MRVIALVLIPLLFDTLLQEVLRDLDSAGAAGRAAVFEALPGRLETADERDREEVARYLVRLLGDPEQERVHVALIAPLVATDTSLGVRTALPLLYGREPTVLRAAARRALEREGGEGVTAALLEHLRRDGSPRARALLALTLGERGVATAGPGLLVALSDPAFMVRGAAAEALVRIYRTCPGYDREAWRQVVAGGPPEPAPSAPSPAGPDEEPPERGDGPTDPATVTTAAPARPPDPQTLVAKLAPTFYGIPLDRRVVVVVLDISSSVRRFGDGPARRRLEEALSLLPSDRRFTVLAFDQRILLLANRPEPARPALKERLAAFLADLPPGQRTELLGPIRTGLYLAGEHLPDGAQLLIISDGAPTVSGAALDDIIERVEGLHGDALRVDVALFGEHEVGLFSYLARRTGGRLVSIPNTR